MKGSHIHSFKDSSWPKASITIGFVAWYTKLFRTLLEYVPMQTDPSHTPSYGSHGKTIYGQSQLQRQTERHPVSELRTRWHGHKAVVYPAVTFPQLASRVSDVPLQRRSLQMHQRLLIQPFNLLIYIWPSLLHMQGTTKIHAQIASHLCYMIETKYPITCWHQL